MIRTWLIKLLGWIDHKLEPIDPSDTRIPYRGLHQWDSEERCMWCRVDRMCWNDCQPCKGPEVQA